MHSWIFRNRHELRRIYGLPPEPRAARPALPPAAGPAPAPALQRGEVRAHAPLHRLPAFVLQPARRAS